ncbi:hypothetical protein [Nonomuraea sp. CA-141351]|uniref:hypothetical protein n=1 Tax=Nonomuraea sp. CA-141351 TaxID=3239996 RepID=UPI003D930EA0
MATTLAYLPWMDEAEHQRLLPAESTKKTLPMVLGRLTFFDLVVVVVVPVGATEPALVSVDGVPVVVSLSTSVVSSST